jgi:hypothetical protein
MRSYPVKKNHIGSAVSKILRYTQTDIHTGGRGGGVGGILPQNNYKPSLDLWEASM